MNTNTNQPTTRSQTPNKTQNQTNTQTYQTHQSQPKLKKQLEKVKLSDYRKALSIRENGNNTETISIKFDYIISLLDNKYEELKFTNEDKFCKDELTNIFLTYINRITSLEKPQDMFILYLNKSTNLEIERPKYIEQLEDIFNIIGEKEAWFYSIKMLFGFKTGSQTTHEILKDTEISNKKDNFISLKNVDYTKSLGLLLTLTNVRTKSKMKFLNINYTQSNVNYINYILTKLNDVNIPKKKKDKSTAKKKKVNAEMKQLLEEISFDSNLYYTTFVDINVGDNDFENEEFKEIIFNL